MKKTVLSLLFLLFSVGGFAEDVSFALLNRVYAYNGENGSNWEETRTTITYFEDLIQPTLTITVNSSIQLKLGVGILMPFDQEAKFSEYFPYVQTRINFKSTWLELGSLSGNHDFPSPILDPLVNYMPRIRVLSETRVGIDYEEFPVTGVFSHGCYEYGIAYGWDVAGTGELYMNWQLPDTEDHRERFDVGATHRFNLAVPLYAGLHYWHNGGHENPHPVAITENYTGAFGLRSDRFNALYVASYYIPNREEHPEWNVFGHGLYFNLSLPLGKWTLEPELFISGELFDGEQVFVSIEGDPFYRVPVYVGLNIEREFRLHDTTTMLLQFNNGTYLPTPTATYDWKNIRYDQFIHIDFQYEFGGEEPEIEEA